MLELADAYALNNIQPLKRGLSVDIELITPDDARALLGRMPKRQRDVSKVKVAEYSSMMREGNWQPVSVLHIDDEGCLANGRHRMFAVVDAGVPQQFVVVRGVSQRAIICLDTGRKRGNSDILFISCGAKNKNSAACITVFLHNHVYGHNALSPVSPPNLVSTYKKFRVYVDAISGLSPNEKLGRGHGIMAFIWAGVMSGDDADLKLRVDDFWQGVALGFGLGHDDPRLLLRSRLMKNASDKANLKPEVMMSLVVHAWNAYADRKGLKVLRPSGKWKEIRGMSFAYMAPNKH